MRTHKLDAMLQSIVNVVNSYHPISASVGSIRSHFYYKLDISHTDGWFLRRLIHLVRLGEIDVKTAYSKEQINVQFFKKVDEK